MQTRAKTILMYIITSVTIVMIAPLVYLGTLNIFKGNTSGGSADSDVTGSKPTEKKQYSCAEHDLEAQALIGSRYEILFVEALQDSTALLICQDNEPTPFTLGTGKIITISNDNAVNVSAFTISKTSLERVKNMEFTYSSNIDGTVLISLGKEAYLFDSYTLKLIKRMSFADDMEVLEIAVSNDRQTIALATQKGLFIADINMSSVKELISSTVDVSGVVTTYRQPHWSQDDTYIYYTTYADDYRKSMGRTTKNLGSNERFPSLEGISAKPVMGDKIFYYVSSSSQTSAQSMFKCGFFDPATRTMKDTIVSNAYYTGVRISNYGSILGAISYNGLMQKINIIDPTTKKTIYSSNYYRIIDYGFSPDEQTMIVLGQKKNSELLTVKVINISWNTVVG